MKLVQKIHQNVKEGVQVLRQACTHGIRKKQPSFKTQERKIKLKTKTILMIHSPQNLVGSAANKKQPRVKTHERKIELSFRPKPWMVLQAVVNTLGVMDSPVPSKHPWGWQSPCSDSGNHVVGSAKDILEHAENAMISLFCRFQKKF